MVAQEAASANGRPAASGAAAVPSDGEGPAPLGVGRRILLAEDNRLNAFVTRSMLDAARVTVDTAEDGAAAVQMASEIAYDLILMDCQMPLVDGYAATRRIREQEARSGARRTVIVAVTASASDSDRERCREAGMDDRLVKPFQESELIALLRRHLGPAAGGSGAA